MLYQRGGGHLSWRGDTHFVPHHAQRASLAVVKGEGETVDAIAKRLKADQFVPGYENTPETRWYYVLYVLKLIMYNTGAYYLTVSKYY